MALLCGDLAQGCKVSLVRNNHLDRILNSAVPAASEACGSLSINLARKTFCLVDPCIWDLRTFNNPLKGPRTCQLLEAISIQGHQMSLSE
jgi:hypothetical protein